MSVLAEIKDTENRQQNGAQAIIACLELEQVDYICGKLREFYR